MFDLQTQASPTVEDFLNQWVDSFASELAAEEGLAVQGIEELLEACRYTLFTGGKRFRPRLVSAASNAVGGVASSVTPFASAVEMVHTYSLVHDDLPCMDNDDFRRGKPTTHKKFSESTALLVGDALLTESFSVLASAYADHKRFAELIKVFARHSGIRGMIGGQCIDLKSQDTGLPFASLNYMHKLKTGALFSLCCEGIGILANVDTELQKDLSVFGTLLGVAFQVADDILDFSERPSEKANFCYLQGHEKSVEYLQSLTLQATSILKNMPGDTSLFSAILTENLERKV